MLITGNMPGWRRSTASSRHCGSVITISLGTRSFTAISTGGSALMIAPSFGAASLARCCNIRRWTRALERLLQVDHLPPIKRKRLTYLKERMTIASIQVDHGEYLYLADKFGFEPVLHKGAFRPLVWDETRHNPKCGRSGSAFDEQRMTRPAPLLCRFGLHPDKLAALACASFRLGAMLIMRSRFQTRQRV